MSRMVPRADVNVDIYFHCDGADNGGIYFHFHGGSGRAGIYIFIFAMLVGAEPILLFGEDFRDFGTQPSLRLNRPF